MKHPLVVIGDPPCYPSGPLKAPDGVTGYVYCLICGPSSSPEHARYPHRGFLVFNATWSAPGLIPLLFKSRRMSIMPSSEGLLPSLRRTLSR